MNCGQPSVGEKFCSSKCREIAALKEEVERLNKHLRDTQDREIKYHGDAIRARAQRDTAEARVAELESIIRRAHQGKPVAQAALYGEGDRLVQAALTKDGRSDDTCG